MFCDFFKFFIFFLPYLRFFITQQIEFTNNMSASVTLTTSANLIGTLARNEMILSCLQEQLFDQCPDHLSSLDLLMSLSPLAEHGDVNPSIVSRNIRCLLQQYCSNEEILLATRAFCSGRHMTCDSFAQRIVQRKSLWRNCPKDVALRITSYVEKVKARTNQEAPFSSSNSNSSSSAMHQLLVNELMIERLSEAGRRNVSGHASFNVPGLFLTIATYDEKNKIKNKIKQQEHFESRRRRINRPRIVTMRALQCFCKEHGPVHLESWHLRALTSRYQQDRQGSSRGAALLPMEDGLSYKEFESLVMEMKVDWYVEHRLQSSGGGDGAGMCIGGNSSSSSSSKISTIRRVSSIEETADEATMGSDTLAPIKSAVVREYLQTKYGFVC